MSFIISPLYSVSFFLRFRSTFPNTCSNKKKRHKKMHEIIYVSLRICIFSSVNIPRKKLPFIVCYFHQKFSSDFLRCLKAWKRKEGMMIKTTVMYFCRRVCMDVFTIHFYSWINFISLIVRMCHVERQRSKMLKVIDDTWWVVYTSTPLR